jgi:hypothetical protein
VAFELEIRSMQTPSTFAIVSRCLDNRKPKEQADTNSNKRAPVSDLDSWTTKKAQLKKM